MPEKIFKKLNLYILPQWKACFFAALIAGFIAHFYKITNWLPNWDSLVFRYDAQKMLSLGRWFLPVVCSVSSFYDLPFLNGLIAIIFHGLGGVFICKLLNIKKNTTAILTGFLVVTFPTVTSVMMYNYVADGYSIAFFLSVLSAYFLTAKKPRYILGAVLLTLAIGIYQAYMTVTVMLILLKLIDDSLFQGEPAGRILKKTLLIFCSGLGGVALYGVILKILLACFSSSLLEYQGLSSVGSVSNIDIMSSLYLIKHTFLDCFFDFSNGFNVYAFMNIFIFVFTLFHYVKYIIANRLSKKPKELAVIFIMALLLVFGAGALAFVNPYVDYHNLMLMGYSVFYLFFLILYERGKEKNKKHEIIKCWAILLSAVILVSNFTVIANVSYHKAQLAYEKSYGALVRIADRIENTPGTEGCDRLLVLGALENSESYSVNLTPDITGITDGYILRADDETVGQSVLCSALNDYCDKNYDFLYGEEKKALASTDLVRTMPEWPLDGCIAAYENVIIIKLGDE
ncbi:MAG: hypothetical protein E7411_07450 [Ruminococcaceae bacterium]|nr:hypothetical protein [Oscillospiraceae bacterium]